MARNDDELEANWAAEAVAVSDDESVVSAGSEDEFEDEQDLELAPAKRSRDEMESGAVGDDAAMDDDADEDAAAVPEKKQKMENAPSRAVANAKGLHKMTAAEHFKIVNDFYVKHRGGALTSLELAEGLNETQFAAPTGLGKHKLEMLPAYIHHLMPKWKKEFVGKGKRQSKSSYFLVLSSSAVRANDVYKLLSSTIKCRVGKLFAKHIKVSEQVELLQRNFFPVSVGTPARIKKLLEMGALSLEHTTYVIVDMQKDKKQMTILELKDTAAEMAELLQFYFLPRLNKSETKLVLF